MQKYNAADFGVRIDEIIKLNSKTWAYLSMYYPHKIITNNMFYSSLYRLAYSIAYPSKVQFINNATTNALHKTNLDLQYFERSEKEVIEALVHNIIKLCIKDERFKNILIKTSNKFIHNNDYKDKYFGCESNVYGKCLMYVRDRKFYSCDPDFIVNVKVDIDAIKNIKK